MAASISARVMPSWMSGLFAMDSNLTCGTRLQTKPWRMSPSVLCGGGDLPVSSASFLMPAGESANKKYGYLAAINRVRARATATRLVSQVIHRRPHCSAM